MLCYKFLLFQILRPTWTGMDFGLIRSLQLFQIDKVATAVFFFTQLSLPVVYEKQF